MTQLTPAELKDWITSSHDFLLIDVREDFERDAFNIGGTHIPMANISAAATLLPAEKDIVLYCEKGIRSVIAIQRLESYGINRLHNLAGGMKAWKASGTTI